MKHFSHNLAPEQGIVCKIISRGSGNNYTGLLSANKDEVSFQIKDNYFSFELGDIVLLEPSGQGTALYEVESKSNAVLITERCNYRCVMCPQPPKNDDSDNARLSIEIIELMGNDVEMLGITGGEPTVAWMDLIEVLGACRKYIPQAGIELLTNARVLKNYELTKELAEISNNSLTACVPIYSDVSQLHDEIVGVKGAFCEAVEGIYNLERLKIPVELRTVITRQNYTRLPNWAEFIYKTFPFACHVAIMGLEPIGLSRKNFSFVWVDTVDYMPMLEEAVKILHRRNMNVSIYNHQLCLLPKKLWRFSRKSISEWKNRYLQICDGCSVKDECGGFFESSVDIGIKGIKAI
jgi:His-Xaa-Ser system radical SAM maturase HxsC